MTAPTWERGAMNLGDSSRRRCERAILAVYILAGTIGAIAALTAQTAGAISGTLVPIAVNNGCTLTAGFSGSGPSRCRVNAHTNGERYISISSAGASVSYSFTVPSGGSETLTYGIPAGGYLNNADVTISVDGGASITMSSNEGGFGSTTSTDLALWTSRALGPGSHTWTITSTGNSVNVYGLWITGGSSPPTSRNPSGPIGPPPTVTGISPGAVGFRNTLVTITGQNLSGATVVDFGPNNPGTISSNSSTAITVLPPPGSGTVDVTVTTNGGISQVTPPDKFTYLVVHVSGNHLVDGNGKVIQLVGVNRSGTEYECVGGNSPPSNPTSIFDGPSDATSLGAMAAWHISVVRVPLNEDCWLGINRRNVDPYSNFSGQTYRQAIRNYVTALNDAGLYVILDLHWNAPGTAVSDLPFGKQQPMADKNHSGHFWSSVAATFRNDPAVLFDLFNEPQLESVPFLSESAQVFPNNSASWQCWLSGCSTGGWWNDAHAGTSNQSLPGQYKTAGMQELVNDVRAAGASQPIMLGGLFDAADLTGWVDHKPTDPGVGGTDSSPIGSPQLVAGMHTYCGTPSVPVCPGLASIQQGIAANVAKTVPVVIGELGEYDCGHSYIDPYMLWSDSLGISYLGWAWNTASCTSFPALIQNYAGSPTCFGVGLLDHLSALAGVGPPSTDIEGCASGINEISFLRANATRNSTGGGFVSANAQGTGSTVTVGQSPGNPETSPSFQGGDNLLGISVNPRTHGGNGDRDRGDETTRPTGRGGERDDPVSDAETECSRPQAGSAGAAGREFEPPQ